MWDLKFENSLKKSVKNGHEKKGVSMDKHQAENTIQYYLQKMKQIFQDQGKISIAYQAI